MNVHPSPIFPPDCSRSFADPPSGLGDNFYNDGGGMNEPQKMAASVFHNMPQNAPRTLTAHEAYDVAAYIHTKPRLKVNPAYKIIDAALRWKQDRRIIWSPS